MPKLWHGHIPFSSSKGLESFNEGKIRNSFLLQPHEVNSSNILLMMIEEFAVFIVDLFDLSQNPQNSAFDPSRKKDDEGFSTSFSILLSSISIRNCFAWDKQQMGNVLGLSHPVKKIKRASPLSVTGCGTFATGGQRSSRYGT